LPPLKPQTFCSLAAVNLVFRRNGAHREAKHLRVSVVRDFETDGRVI
jgi:hypothetical protein